MVGVSESEKATRARLAFSRAHNGNWNAGEMRRAARNDELRSENRWWNYTFRGEPDDVKLHWGIIWVSLGIILFIIRRERQLYSRFSASTVCDLACWYII